MATAGERINFDQLVSTYYESLYRFAFSLTRHEADACDLVQQTFCIWAEKGHQLNDPKKVKTWLFTTLHREFMGWRRKQTRFPHIDLELAAPSLPAIEPATGELDANHVLMALAKLEEMFQAPVALFYLQDCSYLEIAEVLEIPIGTVKSRLSRGIERLHDLLKATETKRPTQ